jgi:hypothetical protein
MAEWCIDWTDWGELLRRCGALDLATKGRDVMADGSETPDRKKSTRRHDHRGWTDRRSSGEASLHSVLAPAHLDLTDTSARSPRKEKYTRWKREIG